MIKNKKKIILLSSLALVILLYWKNALIELAVWNSTFRDGVFLEHFDIDLELHLIGRLKKVENIEICDEIADCYLSVVANEIRDKDLSGWSGTDINLFNTGFRCLTTFHWKAKDIEAQRKTY